MVTAIIAILAAILFPVFARARENARRASCQSNLKQILLGVAQYTQDYDERFPHTERDYDAAKPSWNLIIFPYVKSEQIFQCPSDPNTTFPINYYSGPLNNVSAFRLSYSVNYSVGLDDSPPNVPLSLAQIASPSTLAYLTDSGASADGPNHTTTPTSKFKPAAWIFVDPARIGHPYDDSRAYWSGPHLRHLETANVGFADGHVKALRSEKWFYDNSPYLNPASTP